MPDPEDPRPSDTHRFAWDGFSFRIPSDWNLAAYHFGRGESRVEIQDDFALRLQFDWIRSDQPLNQMRLMDRYDRACGRMEESAEGKEDLPSPAPGWHASLFSLAGKQQFVVAVHVAPRGNFFGLVRLFFEKTGRRQPLEMLNLVTHSFALHDTSDIPWEVYGVSLEVDRSFRLAATTLEAGSQLLQFQWRRRRLMVWSIGMADWVLRQKPLAPWAAGYLAGIRSLEGVTVDALDDRTLACRRRRLRFPLGHAEDIARLCYRYRAFVRHIPEQNRLLLAVFHYRREDDLDQTGGMFGPLLKGTPPPV